MAKKKKSSKKKKIDKEPKSQSSFWPLAGAILMMVLAVFLLLGGFGAGGPLPVGLFEWFYWLFGWAAYFTSLAFLYFGIHKFKSEDRKIPLGNFISMLGFIFSMSVLLHVTFAAKDSVQELNGGHGGQAGAFIGDIVLQALNTLPATLLFIVIAMLTFMLSFGISPKIIMKFGDIFKRKPTDDTDLETLKAKSAFKLNEGVPTERSTPETAPRHANLKNTAAALTAAESHQALTAASDPDWVFPDINLLNQKQDKADAGDVEGNATAIRETFANFNIPVDMEGANVGPRVTQYTLKPPTGVKLTKITALENNLALDLAAHAIRIEAPIPGKRLVGIEVPNFKPAIVRISSVLGAPEWTASPGPLSFVIGKDIVGKPVVGDLAKLPHLLVAGQTNSGKSVMINDILTSFLYRNTPADLKLILIDPKQVELTPYNDIPHLLTPVINEPEKCISALKWAVAEMERRLRTMSGVGKRNIIEYNSLKDQDSMPYIVIVIDELADLMMVAARDVEALIVRLAQKARAAGIHLILATQSPRVTVITGLIKANIPARIAFTVSQEVESRIILDQSGAEKLLGLGDMLYMMSTMPKPKRIQAALIDNEETTKITEFIREQRPPQYDDEVVSMPVQLNGRGGIVADMGNDAEDDLFRDAVTVVIDGRKASTSLLQRRLRVGYARAARLIESMEEQGIVGPADGARPREVLVSSLDDVFGEHNVENPDGDVYDDMPDEEPNDQQA